jgi:ATP-dependent DNA helicase Rep
MARVRKRYGERVICEPSRYLEELPEDDLEWHGGERAEKTTPEKGRSHLAGLRALLDKA